MPQVEIKGTGGASKYEIDFGGPLESKSDLEPNDVQTIDDKTAYLGEVIGGSDYYTGPYPITVKNLDQTVFGSPPDIIVRVDGTRKRVSGGSKVEFTDSDSDSPTVGAGGLCTTATVPSSNNESDDSSDDNTNNDNNNSNDEDRILNMSRNDKVLAASTIIGLGAIAAKSKRGGR